ncbi:MAG: hypothetical protein AB7G13_02580 [Lautropia sp.]
MSATSQVEPARQLQQLRTLAVRRARAALAQADAGFAEAQRVVAARRAAIAASHTATAALGRALVGPLASQLPRWIGLASAERDRLADRIERDEDALIDEQAALEGAAAAQEQARAALGRALAREDAAGDLLRRACQARAAEHERRSERDAEDARRPAAR